MKEHCYNIIESIQVIGKKKIPIITDHQIRFCSCSSIVRIKADGAYSYISINGEKVYMQSKPLKSYEEKLPECAFFRPHKSHLINFHYVIAYNKKERTITMSDNYKIHLTKSNKKQFEQFYSKYVI